VADKLFIISAPSGSGKSTLVNQLRSMVDNLEFSVSYTTRPLRGSEQDGREYHFVARDEFERRIKADKFLEYAEVFGNYYGTSCDAVDHAHAAGKDLILDIDIQGAEQVMRYVPEAVSIFILPPSLEVLEKRLRNRSAAEKVTSEDVIERRLKEARREVERVWEYRYALVNDVLEDAVAELKAIVECERGGAPPATVALARGCNTKAPSPRLVQALKAFGVSLPGVPPRD
jgi:guanylate kinase